MNLVLQACIIHLTGHVALEIVYCMESATDVLRAAQPVRNQLHLFVQIYINVTT